MLVLELLNSFIRTKSRDCNTLLGIVMVAFCQPCFKEMMMMNFNDDDNDDDDDERKPVFLADL